MNGVHYVGFVAGILEDDRREKGHPAMPDGQRYRHAAQLLCCSIVLMIEYRVVSADSPPSLYFCREQLIIFKTRFVMFYDLRKIYFTVKSGRKGKLFKTIFDEQHIYASIFD